MRFAILFWEYLWWHYGKAIREIWDLEKNFLWFFWHFFSISLLSQTLFSPFRRLSEGYKKGFDPQAILESFIVNGILRLTGFALRSVIILIGLAIEIILTLAFLLALLLWVFFLLLLIVLIAAGLGLIFF